MRALILLAAIAACAAMAEPVAVVTAQSGASITLTDERGPCVAEARLAIWRSPDGAARVDGCYLIVPPAGVIVSFLDGERADIPIASLKKPTNL